MAMLVMHKPEAKTHSASQTSAEHFRGPAPV